LIILINNINPLTAEVLYIGHDTARSLAADVAVHRTGNYNEKYLPCFLKEE